MGEVSDNVGVICGAVAVGHHVVGASGTVVVYINVVGSCVIDGVAAVVVFVGVGVALLLLVSLMLSVVLLFCCWC